MQRVVVVVAAAVLVGGAVWWVGSYLADAEASQAEAAAIMRAEIEECGAALGTANIEAACDVSGVDLDPDPWPLEHPIASGATAGLGVAVVSLGVQRR